VIPTYNRAPVLEACLEALLAQTCDPGLFEIIVGDDGSTDATAGVARRFARRGGPVVRHVHQENAGANAARNRAIGVAHGSLVLLINDDTIPTPGMLSHHLDAHDLHPDEGVAVLGRVTVSPELGSSRLAELHLDRAFAALGDRTELDWRAFLTCNISAKRSLLERAGLFEERVRYHEDLELGERLSHLGLRVIYRAEALGYHLHRLNEDEFFGIAAREARALVTWARIAPRLEPVLGMLGFEPALPLARRLRHRAVGLLINRFTFPLWRRVARNSPERLHRFAVRLYDQLYQSAKRTALRRELRRPATRPGGPGLPPKALVLGVGVTVSTFEQAQAALARRVRERAPGYFSCANAYSVTLALDTPDYRRILDTAAFVTADGMPIVWALRWLGFEAERVHNDDLFFACCQRFPEWRHFLVGGRSGQPEEAAAAMVRRFPGIRVVGTHATPARPVPASETEVIVEKLRDTEPDVVWVGMGTPAQDRWMAEVAERANAPLVGVGSLFDLLTGRTRAAPEWMKRTGLQWLFRLLQEPRRLGTRYSYYNARFVTAFASQSLGSLTGRRRRRPEGR
jgi:exopolysaccharide biosynthesis WecB/TagA/CpsF family protein